MVPQSERNCVPHFLTIIALKNEQADRNLAKIKRQTLANFLFTVDVFISDNRRTFPPNRSPIAQSLLFSGQRKKETMTNEQQFRILPFILIVLTHPALFRNTAVFTSAFAVLKLRSSGVKMPKMFHQNGVRHEYIVCVRNCGGISLADRKEIKEIESATDFFR